MSDDNIPPLPLKNLINQVRAELEEAVVEHKKSGRPSMFHVEDVTLEINVTVKREESLKGEAAGKLFVAELKAEGTKTTGAEQVHKVIVRLSAHGPGEAAPGGDDDKPIIVREVVSPSGRMKRDWPLLPLELGTHLSLSPKQSLTLNKLTKKYDFYVQPKNLSDLTGPASLAGLDD